MKGLKFEEINVMEQTQHKKSFSGKADRKAWTAFLIIVLIAITFVLISVFFYLWMKENKEVIQDVSHYEKILGEKGKYKNNYLGVNEIFPDKIPESAIIEQFYYEYYNPWDANYLGYLVYTCDDRTFSEEYTRLKAIQSSKEYLIYGATEFPYELCAILADEYNGFIYALSDTANNRFIYVDLEFCNYICDINYSKIIDKKYLPANFDARRDIRWMTV